MCDVPSGYRIEAWAQVTRAEFVSHDAPGVPRTANAIRGHLGPNAALAEQFPLRRLTHRPGALRGRLWAIAGGLEALSARLREIGLATRRRGVSQTRVTYPLPVLILR